MNSLNALWRLLDLVSLGEIIISFIPSCSYFDKYFFVNAVAGTIVLIDSLFVTQRPVRSQSFGG